MEGCIMWLTSWLHSSTAGFLHPRRARGPRHRPSPERRFAPSLDVLEYRVVPSIFTVRSLADSGPGSLRQAVLDADAQPGHSTIRFADRLHGTIALTSGELGLTADLTIHGPGENRITVSGNHASRIFDISAGVTVTIAGLRMTHGLANGNSPVLASSGGAILNYGHLTLASDVLSNNQAVGDPSTSPFGRPGGAVGGGLGNVGTGTLTVSRCAFISNLALGADGSSGSSAGSVSGGALANFDSATASVAGSWFVDNVARGGNDESGTLDATGGGGAINNQSTSIVTVTGCTFRHNQAIGGNDSVGVVRPGLGVGGAILSGGPLGPTAELVVINSTFDRNQAIGGNGNQSSSNPAPSILGPNDAFGGAIHLSAGTADTISDCTIEDNGASAGTGGPGQNGGLAWGGGIDVFNSFGNGVSAAVSNSTVDHNAVIGGAGGPNGNGSDAWGGGLADLLGATLTVQSTTVDHNRTAGGAGGFGGNGGDGLGGGIYDDALSTLTLARATVEHNRAVGGAAGLGGSDGQGIGGGLYVAPGGVASADLLTVIRHNHASTSDDDVFGDLVIT
jgi:hypothetical protein